MSVTAISILIRQVIVRSVYLAPFVIGFAFIPPPLNILAACLLVLKSKLPSDTDLYEIQVMAKHTVLMLTRNGNDTDRETVERMKEAFVFGDEVLHDADVDGSSTKFLVDTVFGMIEALAVAVMIIWYLAQVF
jgi:hypothetical protein